VYADTLKLFYDPFGGDQIGAVWDPTLKEPRSFRVLGGFSALPIQKVNSSQNTPLPLLTGDLGK
jgi:U3 small nucleolar RNA-associated protein 22